jgi:L-ascorbate metabolism protein UlaG (beta-lactamase superfamily)
VLDHLLPRVPSGLFARYAPPDGPSDARFRMRYIGTAGFVIQYDQHTVVLDPFITRTSLLTTAFLPLRVDKERLARVVPHADDVLVGHAHYDHALDAPDLCARTGARLIGSPAVIQIGRAAGLPDSQLHPTTGGEVIPTRTGEVQGIPSRHGRVYFNRVSLPGDILSPPPWPPRLTDLPHGLVLNWALRCGNLRVVHIDSADFIDRELVNHRADILCLCAIGRKYRPDYVRAAVELTGARFVVACHWDSFFSPYEDEPRTLPFVDLPGFLREIAATGATPVLLPYDGQLRC